MLNLRADERISIELRELYRRMGYLPYKVNQFEEYDLYMQNKRFLASEHVLSFSDMDGKLMALKPDVTLSIIKNTQDDGEMRKLCYAERVYRVPRGAQGFKEIMQVGLEVIGALDAYAMGEVLMLAARSLAVISDSWALDIADLGIVSGILSEAELTDGQQSQLLSLISDKNLHGLSSLCREWDVDREIAGLLGRLITVYGPLEQTLPAFEEMKLPQACMGAMENLRALRNMLKAYGISGVNLDFSVVNDMNYYNGLIFSGFIDGIPQSVLSGGRYDLLMKKMGRRAQAMGFAVYLDQMDRMADEKAEFDVDVLIAYRDEAQWTDAIAKAQELVAGGETVRVQRSGETAIRSRRTIRL